MFAMFVELPTQIPKSGRRLATILSLLFAWALPIFVWLTPKIDERAALFLSMILLWWFVGGLIVRANRNAPWSIHVWIPLLVAPVALFVITLSNIDLSPSSGPGAPLEGIATLIGLFLLVGCALGLLATLRVRPTPFRPYNLVCAVVNTAMVTLTVSSAYANSTRLEIKLTLLDPSGNPVPEATVAFIRYLNTLSGTPVDAERRGHYLSDLQGLVVLPTSRMRHETHIAISKPSFRELQLKLDMPLMPNAKQRRLTLSTKETSAIASYQVPAEEPLPITVILSPIKDTPDPNLKRLSFRSTQDSSPLPDRYLDIETGTLNRELTETSDLELEVTGSYSETTLHLRGLRGILLKTTDSQTTHSYESLYRIAPPDGYSPTIKIKKPGDSPPQTMVYMRLPSGNRYARMFITAIGDSLHSRIRFEGQIHLNESGSRLLE
jgi:hypothetical protein